MLCMKAKLYLVYTNHAKDNVETVKANMVGLCIIVNLVGCMWLNNQVGSFGEEIG